MKDFITEAWLRANHTLSEGAEIHLPADSRLTPSARELLESRHLRIKFIDEQGRLFVDDEQQQPQPVHGLTSSDEHPQACCELCRQPVAKKPDTLTHLSAEKMVAKSDPRLGFRAVLDSTIALAVWLQIELAEPWQPWLADIRSRLGNIMRADALGEPLGCQAIVGLSDEDLHRLSHQPLRYLDHDHLVPEASHGRDAALLNLLRTKVRETETVAAQVFITRSFEVFGGGSVLDAAKAVALLVTNPDSTLAEMSETSVLQPRLPLIAIPTTAGTGSETTNVTVIIDAVSGRKQVLAHASLMPDVAILDAALTEGVPSHVTAMTGIDALTHAIEAYSALNATPFTDSLAIGAIAMIGKSLPKAVGYGHDLAARESMLLASCMAGMAFSSAGLGLCHAMAHQPGAALHIPHGLANAMLLPTVMEFNRMVCRERFSQIGRALRTKKSDDHDAINAVSELIAEVGIGKRLGDVGATSAHYGAWAQAAQEDICLRSNPRTASLEQIVGLYAAAQ